MRILGTAPVYHDPGSKGRRRLRFFLAVVVVGGISLAAWMLFGRESESIRFMRGLRPVVISRSVSTVRGTTFERSIFVIHAEYEEFFREAHRELCLEKGWGVTRFNDNGKMGGGPFADFTGGGFMVRIIRGDRTIPPSLRTKIPEADRKNWVVISANWVDRGPIERVIDWLKNLL